jgi:hypothetical protein
MFTKENSDTQYSILLQQFVKKKKKIKLYYNAIQVRVTVNFHFSSVLEALP